MAEFCFRKRLGSFKISKKMLFQFPKEVMRALSKCVILRAEYMIAYDKIEYFALCEDFDIIEEGCLAEEYELIFEKTKDGFKSMFWKVSEI